MANLKDLPDTLAPYQFHGVNLNWNSNDKEALATCPWCTRPDKFSVNVANGLWRCLVCNEGPDKGKQINGGNLYTFLKMLDKKSFEATRSEAYQRLATDRNFLFSTSLVEWGLSQSLLTQEWLVPGWNVESKLTGLYRYAWNGKTNRTMLWPTPTLGHHLFGMNLYDPAKPELYLLEGIWDSIAFWEVASKCMVGNGELVPTSSREESLIGSGNVIGIAGNLAFREDWSILFANKHVHLMCQNDHPRKHPITGADIPPASWIGMQRVARILNSATNPPASIDVLQWGNDGYNVNLPSGFDVRDYLTGAK